MSIENVNVENMYEGKNIRIVLDRTNLDNFVIREFVLDEKMNEHQKLEIQLEMDDEQRKNLERIIQKEDVEIQVEVVLKKRNGSFKSQTECQYKKSQQQHFCDSGSFCFR